MQAEQSVGVRVAGIGCPQSRHVTGFSFRFNIGRPEAERPVRFSAFHHGIASSGLRFWVWLIASAGDFQGECEADFHCLASLLPESVRSQSE